MNVADEMRVCIDELNELDREYWGDLSIEIGEQAMEEPYENDKQLHNLFNQYYKDDKALEIINDTLISVCGWSLNSLMDRVYGD